MRHQGQNDTSLSEVVVLALCEQNHVTLKPDTLYRLEVREGCEECRELAEVAS